MWRAGPGFSPLDFRQWFIGKVNGARDFIDGSWEQSADGVQSEHDFVFNYSRKSYIHEKTAARMDSPSQWAAISNWRLPKPVVT
ncbi:hypothetical protein DP119_10515 [Planococcus maitriensis]|uniref:Uncharacterized protein n=1 Tax=Planococcus maitriensis TaxID=221799 RepID=A0A365K3I0_9BACL|nr:hypothetical protein DP119_10515 [Planococcus maitriensis]